MKYYLVNYIILNNKTVIENEHIGLALHAFASIEDFKKSIFAMKNNGSDIDKIVIKSYKQISKEAFNSLTTAVA